VAALLIVAWLALVDPVGDPALASRIQQLIDATFSDSAPASAAADVRKIFAERGVPTIEMVGSDAAEDYIVLSAGGQSLGFMKDVLAAVERMPGAVPPYAVVYLRARLKQKDIESRLREPYPNAALGARLHTLFTTDQAVRKEPKFDGAKMRDTDARTGQDVRAIFRETGVPTRSAVGAEAAREFVVMVQHQPPDLRRAVLPKLRENVDRGEADPADYAMMFDRAQVDDGKPQRYGANFSCQPDGTLAPSAIEDDTRLDARRAEIGLLPMRLYAKLVRGSMPQDFCKKVTSAPPKP
jgi:hypothetical protein